MTDSNCRHKEYESSVLPTELIYNKDIWQLEWDSNPEQRLGRTPCCQLHYTRKKWLPK